MTSALLVGFADVQSPLPDGLTAVDVGGGFAILTIENGPTTLPEISARLLKLQENARIVPLRPAPVPTNLADHIQRIQGGLAQNFEALGRTVEFVVQLHVPKSDAPDVPAKPSDYLRQTQKNQQDFTAACVAGRATLGAATQTLETKAKLIKSGERNLNDLVAIHYLMNRDHAQIVISEWHAGRASVSAKQASLSGPWAPYSFVTLES
jgi:Gas vesicle synthesis protein GvpL/GvpF